MATTPDYRPDLVEEAAAPLRSSRDRARAVWGGVLAGLAAGVALWVWNAFWNLTQQGVFWPTFKGSALPFLGGERVMDPGFDAGAVLLGAVLHLLISAGWGALFALIFFGIPRALTVLAGLFWGLIVWLGMYYVLLPLMGLSAVVRATPVGMAILTHLVFGLILGLAFLPFQRQYPRVHKPERLAMPHREPVTP